MFQPVVPAGGYLGWTYLERTRETQMEAFTSSPVLQRETDYFRENIAKVKSAEDLVNDRRLLTIALGAFGLEDDINHKAFIKEILAEGTLKEDALANRLADKTYQAFSRTFGFADLGGLTGVPGFADKIIARYEERSFEKAVGEQNDSLRQAMNLERGLQDVLKGSESNNARWFSIMGNPPLRSVFETALGFGQGFGALDIDKQLTNFEARAESVFGTSDVAELAEPEMREKIVRLFLVRSEINAGFTGYSSASAALSLLQSAPRLYA
ncbi:DUF1217 domain-containing protein [Pseudoroseicyclus sp. CXY001]|uniref:DUF1217 domain-containing protein n=1 Tax=Pseudoroseicyclus sp. CXY001 TaxID=3242492 RepID=UPI003570FEA1